MRTERCALTSTSMVDSMQDMRRRRKVTCRQLMGMPDQGARAEATGGES